MVCKKPGSRSGRFMKISRLSRPDATRRSLHQAAKAANANFFIRQLRFYDHIFQMLENLCLKGQRQLLTIARVSRFQVLRFWSWMRPHHSSILSDWEVLIQDAFNQLMVDQLHHCSPLVDIQNADMILVMVDSVLLSMALMKSSCKRRCILQDTKTWLSLTDWIRMKESKDR